MFRLDRFTKEATSSPPHVLSSPVLRRILGSMSDAEDLACRYLHLWQEYLTALMVDPKEPKFLELWIAACSALAGNPPPPDLAAVEQTWLPGSSPSAASPTRASP